MATKKKNSKKKTTDSTKSDKTSKTKNSTKPKTKKTVQKKISKKNSTKKTSKKKTSSAKKAALDQSNDRLGALAMFLSGEMLLDEQREELQQMKKEAVKLQQDKVRSDIKDGSVKLEDTTAYTADEITATGGAQKVVQKIDLYSWTAPVRVTFPFDPKLFISIVVLSLIFVLYLAVLGHYGLMFVIIALLFLVYVAGTTEPISVTHTITTRGIDSLDTLYEWYKLGEFWFSKKNDQHMLIVDTRLRSPGQLIMLLNEEDVTPVFMLLQDKLLYKDYRRQGRISKMTYGEFIPIEKV